MVVKDDREDNQMLEEFIIHNIEGARKISEVSSEATYLLPKGSESQFPDFFSKFDRMQSELKISSYGVSMTTLEEVFLKVENDGEGGTQEMEGVKRRMTERRKSEKAEEAYSISNEQISGVFNVFFLHLIALFVKRLILSKRSIKGLLVDLFVPIFLIILGILFSTVTFFNDSGQRVLSPTLFPNPQEIIFNCNPIFGDGSSKDILNLLNSSDSFYPNGINAETVDNLSTLKAFDSSLFKAANDRSMNQSSFGGYFFHTIDNENKTYKVVSLINSTSQDAPAAFSHFIYEAILRKAIGDSNLNFTVVNDPMPITRIWLDTQRGNTGFSLTFIVGIAFALIPTSLVSFLLLERTNQLVHQQKISGMNKLSYWVSSFIFDIIKVYIPVVF